MQSAGAPSLRETGFGVIAAALRKEQPLEEVRDTLVQVLDSLPANPPTAEEVERLRAHVL